MRCIDRCLRYRNRSALGAFDEEREFPVTLERPHEFLIVEVEGKVGVLRIEVAFVDPRFPLGHYFTLGEQLPVDVLAPGVLLDLLDASGGAKPLLGVSLE